MRARSSTLILFTFATACLVVGLVAGGYAFKYALAFGSVIATEEADTVFCFALFSVLGSFLLSVAVSLFVAGMCNSGDRRERESELGRD